LMSVLLKEIDTAGIEITPDLLSRIAIAHCHTGDSKQARGILEQVVHHQRDMTSQVGFEALETLVERSTTAEELSSAVQLVQFLIDNRGPPSPLAIDRYTALAKLGRVVLKKEGHLRVGLGVPQEYWKSLVSDVTGSSFQPSLKCYTSILALQVQLSLGKAEKQQRKESLRTLSEAEELLSKMRYDGISPDSYVYNILLNGFASLRFVDLKFEERLNRALKVLESMKTADVRPNTRSYTSLFNACLPVREWVTQVDMRVVQLEEEMRASGLTHDAVSAGTFIRVLGSGRLFQEMYQAFYRFRDEPIRDISLYNSLLHSSKEHPAQASRALNIYFDDSKKFPQIKPDFLTLRWLLGCCVTSKRSRLASWIVSTYAREVHIAVDSALLNSLLAVHFVCDEVAEATQLISHGFASHGVKPGQDTVKIVLSHYLQKQQDFAGANEVLVLLKKAGADIETPLVIDLIVRAHLLSGNTDTMMELLQDPMCDKETYRGVVQLLRGTKKMDDHRTAKKIFELMETISDDRGWTNARWFQALKASL